MKLADVTLAQWAILDAVIQEGGYLKAAQKLHKSHSSLHHAVAKLQLQLGVQLIETKGKKISATEIGEVIHRRSKQLLQDAADIEKLARRMNEGWESEITLAVENIFPKSVLHPILHEFSNRNHTSRLRILDVVLLGAVQTIEQASADLVISPIVPSGHLGTPLLSVTLYPFAHVDHPLNQMENLPTERDLTNALQIVIKDTANNSNEDHKNPLGWLKAEKRWTVSDFYHAREILKTGQGFCWAPTHFLAEDIKNGILKAISTEGDLARIAPLYLVNPKPETSGPGVNLLAKMIRELELSKEQSTTSDLNKELHT